MHFTALSFWFKDTVLTFLLHVTLLLCKKANLWVSKCLKHPFVFFKPYSLTFYDVYDFIMYDVLQSSPKVSAMPPGWNDSGK